MNVNVPPTLSSLSLPLAEFFNGMVSKLHVNSHKNAVTEDDVDSLLAKLQEEIQEFRDQKLADASDPNVLAELFDASNFCFLLYAYLRSRGVRDMKERFIDEYFTVDIATGKIFAAKTRPGSPHKPGERVFGSMRAGVAHLRAQNGSLTISVPIRDIVWWKATGKWPEGRLRYKPASYQTLHAIDCKDCFTNLVPAPHSTAKLPFVSQYKPRGKENTKNFGRWVYRRRHLFKLVCVGYWDTAEEAASEGLKAWKRKIADV